MEEQHKVEPAEYDLTRRSMFGAMTGLGAFAAMADSANAQAKGDDKPVFNAYDRTKTFGNNEMNSGLPWTAKQTGNFDLEDPIQNNLAKLKISGNLIGKRTYIPMLTRMLIARDDLPGGLLLGAASMFTWQLQVPDAKAFPDLPSGTAIMRSMFTAVYLDPNTMMPVATLKNPFNGAMMTLEDYTFVENFLVYPKGGSRFIEEPQFANNNPNESRPVLIKPWGDDLVLFNGGIYKEPGKHQPRFTENTWRSPAADVMNPDVALVQTNYNFLGVNKAFEKPWTGYKMGDIESFVSLATGKKVHSAEDLPDFHKRVLAEKYPDRL